MRRPDAIVLGAGAVGLCVALHLQRRGLAVLLIDREIPGRAASFGNAGVVSPGSIWPLAQEGLWQRLPSMLLGRTAGIRLPLRHLHVWAGWGVRMLARYSTPQAIDASRAGLAALCGQALRHHRELLEEAGGAPLMRVPGFLKVCTTEEEVAAASIEAAEYQRRQIRHRLLDRAELREIEPHLRGFGSGLLITEAGAAASPGEVCAAYAELFAARGGQRLTTEIRDLAVTAATPGVVTAAGRFEAPHLVCALGAWSAALLRPLGYRVPLIAERGYHRHYAPLADRPLGRPVHDVGGGFVAAPQSAGIRLTSGSEMAPLEAPPTPVGVVWMGARPTLPDSLPMIGPAPRHAGLWLAFGHQHIGFSTSAVSGALLAAQMTGAAPPLDAQPYWPARML